MRCKILLVSHISLVCAPQTRGLVHVTWRMNINDVPGSNLFVVLFGFMNISNARCLDSNTGFKARESDRYFLPRIQAIKGSPHACQARLSSLQWITGITGWSSVLQFVMSERRGACIDCGRKIASAVCLSGWMGGSVTTQGDTVIS